MNSMNDHEKVQDMIKIHILSVQDKIEFCLPVDCQVLELKEEIFNKMCRRPFEEMTIIFLGKKLNDEEIIDKKMNGKTLILYVNPWQVELKFEEEFKAFCIEELKSENDDAEVYLDCLKQIRASIQRRGDLGFFLHRLGRMISNPLIPQRMIPLDEVTMKMPQSFSDRLWFLEAIGNLLHFMDHKYRKLCNLRRGL